MWSGSELVLPTLEEATQVSRVWGQRKTTLEAEQHICGQRNSFQRGKKAHGAKKVDFRVEKKQIGEGKGSRIGKGTANMEQEVANWEVKAAMLGGKGARLLRVEVMI
jgi:hypothetical protein